MKPYINRELSWLQFNQRVLKQALDDRTPLLEKAFFMSIYGSNLAEFFMVRIGSLSDQSLLLPDKVDEKTGQTASQQIKAVMDWLSDHDQEVATTVQQVHKAFMREGFYFLDLNKLSKVEKAMAKRIYQREIMPLLSAQIIDPHHPFPFLDNNASYLMVRMESKKTHLPRYGIVPLDKLPVVKTYSINDRQNIMFTSDLVSMYVHSLFKHFNVLESVVIRVTRNADIDLNGEAKDEHDDFLDIVSALLKKRKRLQIVRLQLSNQPSNELSTTLQKVLKISPMQMVVNHYPLDLSYGFVLKSQFKDQYPHLVYPPVTPVVPIDFATKSGMAYLKDHDLLLSFPYQSSSCFIQLLYEAGNDPRVVSIKMTLYRLDSPSRIAAALSYAAEKGKDVMAVMELRARFDEQSNIDYSKMLENAGVRVIYGHSDYKVHSKLCLITSMDKGEVSTITYVGTGNFNESTQAQYTDLAILTSNALIGQDANDIFDALAINEVVDKPRALWVAPKAYVSNLLAEIDQEIAYARQGHETEIVLKVNSLNDRRVMDKLIEASQAKIPVFLLIRGICCLIPNISGVSENITVKSIVGRHLEHTRIFQFGKGDRSRLYIGSGDFLNRNTQRRIEVFIPVLDPTIKTQVQHILDVEKDGHSYGWIMGEDQEYSLLEDPMTQHSQDILRRYFQAVKIQQANPSHPTSWWQKIWEALTTRKKA